MPPRKGSGPVWMRKPTATPITTISVTTKTLRARSARVRPASTAERAMGSERNRSSSPVWRSVPSPMAAPMAPNTEVCTIPSAPALIPVPKKAYASPFHTP